LHGNAGNDFISGGQGDDSIIFNRGDRHDFIIPDIRDAMDRFCQDDHDRHFSGDVSDNGKDTVKFGANPLDLIFSKSCGSLNVSINGTSDRLTLAGGKHGDTSLVDVFEASDGRRLLNTQVDQLIQAMATFCSSSGMTWSQAAQQRPTEVQQVLAQFWQPQ
jgi:Ca2+-binding RTX toxin-like protein